MTTVAGASSVSERALQKIAATYGRVPAPLRAAHPKALEKAIELAGGNYRRLTIDDDGGIIVWKKPVW